MKEIKVKNGREKSLQWIVFVWTMNGKDVGEDDEDVQEEVGSTAAADGDEGMAKRQKRNTEGRTD